MNFKKKIAYLVLLLVIGHITLYLLFSILSARRCELVIKDNEFIANTRSCDVLIMGDSHAERGLDMRELPGVTSLAFYGENNFYTYYRIKRIIANGIKIKYLVLPCDKISFTRGFHNFRTHKFFYYSLANINEIAEEASDPVNEYYNWVKARMLPYAEWQYGLNIWSRQRVKKGSGKFSDLSVDERAESARYFVQSEMDCCSKLQNLYYPPAINYLKKTIELCKSAGIKPIFVRFPLSIEVTNEIKNNIGGYSSEKNPSDSILRATNMPLLDFEAIFYNKNSLFFDSHHLNIYGRKFFTPLFKERLDSLMRIY